MHTQAIYITYTLMYSSIYVYICTHNYTVLYIILYFQCINTYTYIIRYILTCFCYASWNVDSTKTHSVEAMPGTWNCVCGGRRGWDKSGGNSIQSRVQ